MTVMQMEKAVAWHIITHETSEQLQPPKAWLFLVKEEDSVSWLESEDGSSIAQSSLTPCAVY